MLASDFPSSQVTTTAGAGCGSVLVRQFPHLAAKLADRDANSRNQLMEQCNQCQKLPEPVHDRLTTSSSEYCCGAAEYWQQKLVANHQCAAVPLVAQDVIFAPASQAFVERLFSVCGLLTQGTRNRMEKNLYMRAWLKVNFDELNDML